MPGGAKSIVFELPDRIIVAFDRFLPVADVSRACGLILNVQLEAETMAAAIEKSKEAAGLILSMLSFVASASVEPARVFWIYDASDGLEERDFCQFIYDPVLRMRTRRVEHSALFEVLQKAFDGFLGREDIKSDFKLRLVTALQSFRRGLSDNDDVLTEFLIHWSSLETLDIVYRNVLGTNGHLSGLKEVFNKLRPGEGKFSLLKDLRDDVSHGAKPLSDAVVTARENLELVRKAVQIMIMKILSIEDNIQKEILDAVTYKGKFAPHHRALLSGKFEPGYVRALAGHPSIQCECTGIKTSTEGEKLNVEPTWTVSKTSFMPAALRAWETYGEEAQGPLITGLDVQKTSE
jgi:hypothetical protein